MGINKIGAVTVFAAGLFLLAACVCFTGAYAQGSAATPATTLDNLMAAYNGENNAHARYLAFAKKASEEGYDAAASMFRAAALAEKVHYERHAEIIKELGGTPETVVEALVVNSTPENIEAAFRSETYEKDVIYPSFLKQAKVENIEDAIKAFEDAVATEGVHVKLYSRMLQNMELSKGLVKDFYVCPVCGNIVDAITGTMCPICFTNTQKFVRVK